MRTGTLSLAVLALPLVAATSWVAWVAGAETLGRRSFAPPPFRNSAEAAAAGDAASMLRLIRMGDDPGRVHPICCELISSQVQYATTLEAALWSRRIDSVRLLDREGAIVDPGQRRDLACLAADLEIEEAVVYLGSEPSCVKGAALERVLARTREAGGADE
jgi:hypothetical protein